ncbi:MAG: hypothetical protein HYZ90_01200, partial [Candidatus Omnitrophica bacterium]|nr:hypothetical protein [Candidatus Omnitrophota bacterium]
ARGGASFSAGPCAPARGGASKKLLVTLGAPWINSISMINPARSIEDRWTQEIQRAVSAGGFTQVDIRPHPRERDPYPQGLVGRLEGLGISARTIDSSCQALSEILCDYAGLIGAPSGALAEGAVCCQRGFVIGLEGVERGPAIKPVAYYSDQITVRPAGQRWEPEDFLRPPPANGSVKTVGEVLQSWVPSHGR